MQLKKIKIYLLMNLWLENKPTGW